MGRLASLKCWNCLTVQCWSMVRLAGAADVQHLAVARSALQSDRQLEPCADWCSFWPVSWGGLARAFGCFQLEGLQCGTLPGDSFAWQQVGNLQCQCSMGRLASLECWISGQICFAIRTCSSCAGQSLASELGWFDQCSWLLSTPRLVLDFGRFAMLQPSR